MMEFNKTDPSVMAVDVNEQLAKVRKGGYGWIGKLCRLAGIVNLANWTSTSDKLEEKTKIRNQHNGLPRPAHEHSEAESHERALSQQMTRLSSRKGTRCTGQIKIQIQSDLLLEYSTKISNDQELIQSDPIYCPQNQNGNN